MIWAVIPFARIAAGALGAGGTPTGAWGVVPVDQLQYLAWIRQAGDHILSANLHQVGSSDAVFLHPLFLGSGLLWKLGVPIQLAYLAWLPVAVGVLSFGVVSYVRRLVPDGASQWAAFILALFMAPPLIRIANSVGIADDAVITGTLQVLGFELNAVNSLWGYLPTAIAVGLIPLVFLATERGVTHAGKGRPQLLAAASSGALLASWLHPWQGLTIVLVLGALLVWYRFERDKLPLTAVIASASIPLVYYFVLSQSDPSWARASEYVVADWTLPMAVVAFVGFSPFLLLAVLGVRRPVDIQERMLLLWPAAAILVLFTPTAGWFHGAAGAATPLAILMVRGWQSLKLPRAIRARGLERTTAAVLIAAIVVPGAVALIRDFSIAYPAQASLYYTKPGEARALEFLRNLKADGAVVTDPVYGSTVPAFTGRRVWNGHFNWTPNATGRDFLSLRILSGRVSAERARAALARTGAKFLLTSCAFPPEAVQRRLGNVVTPMRTFDCAGVYRIR
jgi:hypothetical protein